MRRVEWVNANLLSVARNRLSVEEQDRLAAWMRRVG